MKLLELESGKEFTILNENSVGGVIWSIKSDFIASWCFYKEPDSGSKFMKILGL